MEFRPQITLGQASGGEALSGQATGGQISGQASPEHGVPADKRNGCPWHDVVALLREVKLRPTRQRMALGWLLFAKGDRHLTAEMLYEEANRAKIAVSLATVYNTLHQFTDAGLLREVTVNGSKTYFDTNVSDHHHFFIESEHNLVDIPDAKSIVGELPQVPEGYEISRVDVVVRLKPKKR
jgi:Fur family iron response transcriptional regulator